MENSKRAIELKKILNTVKFGTLEWNQASDELRKMRQDDIAKNPVALPKNWCESDGKWYY